MKPKKNSMKKDKRRKIKWFGPIGETKQRVQYFSTQGRIATFYKCGCGKCSQDWHLGGFV